MRRLPLALGLLLMMAAIGLLLLGRIVWGGMHEPYKGYETEQFVEIPEGVHSREIGRQLIERGVVRDAFVFRTALWWSARSRDLKAGEYRFAQPLSAIDVIDRIARGDVYVRKITFPEGLTIREMAAIYESRGFGSAAEFARAAKEPRLIADLDPQASDLEGYLFPETYALPRGLPVGKLIPMMVDGFRAAYTDKLRRAAETQGLTTRQVVTLAALVEKETGHEGERPLVAAVYRNRMKRGMPMQADPTLIYALQKAGRYDGNIRKADMAFDSPYNTYRNAGLPPGPIASPSKASLTAAIHPADVKYLYFVSRNDGTHVFASTLAEHNMNVRKYQVEYFRRQRR